MTFANAGHLPPLLVDEAGSHFLDTECGLPLGLSCGDYSQSTVTLSPGSRLVFYSDGITEALNANDEEYGVERLAHHLKHAEASAITILDDVRTFAGGVLPHDDASVVFVKVTA